MALERHEAVATEFLNAVIEEAKLVTDQHVADPREWTVQERMWAVASYLCVMQEGDVNFPVGDKARFSDYFLAGTDFPAKGVVDLGTIGGDQWVMRPLIGAEAEAIELLQYTRDGKNGRYHWLTGAMAAQLRRPSDIVPDPITQHADYGPWLRSRIEAIEAHAESEFTALFRGFLDGQDKLAHFFRIGFDAHGILAMPVVQKERAEDALPPARFPADSCISKIALSICGKPDQSGV